MGSALDRALARVLGTMTDDAQERRNVFWRTVAMVLGGATAALYGGELWAGFLTQTGFSTDQIGFLSSVGTFSGAFGLLAFMGLADRIQARIRVYALCLLGTALPPLLTVAVALVPRPAIPLPAVLAVLVVVTSGQALLGSICVMLDYPILVRTISVGARGRMFAILTTAYGVLAILMGLLSAGVLKNVAYPLGYAWCFLTAAGMPVLSAAAFIRQRERPELAVPGASRSALPFTAIVDVLKLKEFQWLAGPHVLRGLGSGLAGFAIPLGLRYLGLPQETPGYATAVNYAAGVLGGLALGLIADRWGAGRSTLLGDLLLALGMGTLMGCPSLPLFLTLYFLLHLGRNIEDSAVPFGTTIIVPPEHMGAFSAARLMILQGSSSLGSLLFGRLFRQYHPLWLFGLGAAMKGINGVWFWWVFRLKPPVEPGLTHLNDPEPQRPLDVQGEKEV